MNITLKFYLMAWIKSCVYTACQWHSFLFKQEECHVPFSSAKKLGVDIIIIIISPRIQVISVEDPPER